MNPAQVRTLAETACRKAQLDAARAEAVARCVEDWSLQHPDRVGLDEVARTARLAAEAAGGSAQVAGHSLELFLRAGRDSARRLAYRAVLAAAQGAHALASASARTEALARLLLPPP